MMTKENGKYYLHKSQADASRHCEIEEKEHRQRVSGESPLPRCDGPGVLWRFALMVYRITLFRKI